MKNYTKLQTKYIDEIQSNVTIYSHDLTHARICVMENDDTNKVFSIAFRTPAINDCGLTHILEHSVLCGSRKYPVKDPFVELLKGSLNTFLNAFTFPDKTMYPCASQNLEDFKNLMSVYMDAVFYPQIYNHEEIFMQEGWHYHILDENEPITYNGVVYNEMKGAFSDPQQVLFRKIMHSVFNNNTYQYESGGDPKYIPDLSYEEFKDFHSKFYHPSNSYIMLYGDCDMEERLMWLDKEYLSKFNRISFDTTVKYEKPFDKPVYVNDFYQIDPNESKENKTFLSYNVVLPTTLDTKLMIAIEILVLALLQSPGAPLKEALIKANLGEDIDFSFDDGLLQPLLSIVVVNSNKSREDEFIRLVDHQLNKMVKYGLDKTLLESLLNFAEFKAREKSFSMRMPKGLDIEMTCLSSWLYSDEHPFSKLEVLKYYKELREDLKGHYFEDILDKYILNNNHKSYLSLEPSYDCNDLEVKETIDKLKAYKDSLSHEELLALIEKNKKLLEYQNAPSAKEAIDTLPKLKLSDINPLPDEYKLEVIDGDYKVLFSDYSVNDIAYIKYYFDISGINYEDLLYTSLFLDTFKQLSTINHTYQDIDQIIKNNTGGLAAGISNLAKKDGGSKLYVSFGYSALTDKAKVGNDLLIDLVRNTIFDEKRLYERLCELKSSLEMSVVNRGHQVSANRALAQISELYRNREYTSGIAYIDFICDLAKNYESRKDEIIAKLQGISKTLFAKDNLVIGFTGERSQLNKLNCLMDTVYNLLPEHNSIIKSEFIPEHKDEAFKAQFNVNFCALAGKYSIPYTGAFNVLNNCLSMDYLWQRVRVNGGAYGCMLNVDPYGRIVFTSYRDPNISKTFTAYREIVDFIKNLNPTDEELLGYKIGAIGSSQAVMHDSDKAEMARSLYLRGISYEERRKTREELINTTKEELVALNQAFIEALGDTVSCVIGNSNSIDLEKDLFTDIRSLIK